MKLCYGIEMKSVEHLPLNELEPFFQAIYEKVNIIDDDQELFIVRTSSEAETLMELLKEKSLFEAFHTLYSLEVPKLENTFIDYGFKTANDNHYLYEEMTTSFVIHHGQEDQIKMALYQIEEDLIAADFIEEEIYFIDKASKELIEGYARAYEISLKFNESRLDKFQKQE